MVGRRELDRAPATVPFKKKTPAGFSTSKNPETPASHCAFDGRRRQGVIMVNPLDIMPVLALALMIVLLPLAADRP